MLNLKKYFVEYKLARATASKAALCLAEIKHITKHRPWANRYRGGNGRR